MGAGGQGGGGSARLATGSRRRSFPTRPLSHARARPRAAGRGGAGAGLARGKRKHSRSLPTCQTRACALSGARGLPLRILSKALCSAKTVVAVLEVRGLRRVQQRGLARLHCWVTVPLLRHLLRDAPQRKARPLHTLNPHFRARWLRSRSLSCSSRPQLRLTAKDLQRAPQEQPLQSPLLPRQSPRELRNLPATPRKKVILRAFSL